MNTVGEFITVIEMIQDDIVEIKTRLDELEKKKRGIIIPPADPPPDLGITDDDEN